MMSLLFVFVSVLYVMLILRLACIPFETNSHLSVFVLSCFAIASAIPPFAICECVYVCVSVDVGNVGTCFSNKEPTKHIEFVFNEVVSRGKSGRKQRDRATIIQMRFA